MHKREKNDAYWQQAGLKLVPRDKANNNYQLPLSLSQII